MKIYRNHYSKDGGGSNGFSFHSSKSDAVKAVKAVNRSQQEQFEEPSEIAEPLEIELSKKGILQFLNRNAGHPDNG
jgi:hypothetical protein